MIPRKCAAATASLFGAVWGCGASSESSATLEGMFPAMSYNDAPSTVLIQGRLFRPTYHFDMMAGTAQTEVGSFSASLTPVGGASSAAAISIPLDAVTWQSPTALSATIPAGVAVGAYDLSVVDPRGQSLHLAAAFESLGPDDQAPVVTIDAPEPDRIIGAQTKVIVSLTADDGAGWLASLGATVSTAETRLDVSCMVPAATRKTPCRFEFIAPAPAGDADTVTLAAWATDSVGKETRPQPAIFTLAPRPSLTSLSPIVGPAGGGTPIEIHGTDFLASPGAKGTQLLINGQVVTGATVVSATEIVATTPPHDPGFARLTASTGGAASEEPFYFEFVAAPILKMVSPSRGPVTGGTWIIIAGNHFRDPQTKIYFFGNVPLPCQRFVSPTRIQGRVPPASATGPTAIVAVDEPGGSGMLVDAFSYDPVDTEPPDGGVDPTNCEGAP